jgi:DNA-binding PadR family transcriptional regulator
MEKSFLGEFEQMVLLAILQLEQSAYGHRISAELEERAGRRVSRGALYSSLDRLERKGYLRWEIAPATSERGGQPKRRFEVTAEGLQVLRVSHQAWLSMKAGLEDLLSRQRP